MKNNTKKVRRVIGKINYKGVIQIDNYYTLREEEGPDWYRLLNGTYIPKTVVGHVYEDDSDDEYLPYYDPEGLYEEQIAAMKKQRALERKPGYNKFKEMKKKARERSGRA